MRARFAYTVLLIYPLTWKFLPLTGSVYVFVIALFRLVRSSVRWCGFFCILNFDEISSKGCGDSLKVSLQRVQLL